MEDSVAAKSKLPTKMFFISSSVFQSCALDSADLDLGQVVAGLSKGSLSIAGHCQPTGGSAPGTDRTRTPGSHKTPVAGHHRNAYLLILPRHPRSFRGC